MQSIDLHGASLYGTTNIPSAERLGMSSLSCGHGAFYAGLRELQRSALMTPSFEKLSRHEPGKEEEEGKK